MHEPALMSGMVCIMHTQDSFYRGLTQQELDNVKNYNFDHPDAVDMKVAQQQLCKSFWPESVGSEARLLR